MGVKMGKDVVKFTSRQKNGVPFGTPFSSFALKIGGYVRTRISRITLFNLFLYLAGSFRPFCPENLDDQQYKKEHRQSRYDYRCRWNVQFE
jgi:hypothetical protein